MEREVEAAGGEDDGRAGLYSSDRAALICRSHPLPPLSVRALSTDDEVGNALSVIRDYGLNLERTKVEDEPFPDPKDVVFYEVALSKEDAYLVTGNTRHFPKKPFVVTPAEMIAIIEGADKNLILSKQKAETSP